MQKEYEKTKNHYDKMISIIKTQKNVSILDIEYIQNKMNGHLFRLKNEEKEHLKN